MANIEDIEGVGPTYAQKLADAGIGTIEKLLEAGGTRAGREDLAAKTGISAAHLLKWVNHADMMRLNGVGPQFAELLESAGVDSVAELAQRNAANLTAKLAEVNDLKKLSGTSPSESMVTRWIEEAARLEKKVTH